MADRITLREEDFGAITLSESKELTVRKSGVTARQLKVQILDDNEKVPKLEAEIIELRKSFDQLSKDNQSVSEEMVTYLTENYQLKEEIENDKHRPLYEIPDKMILVPKANWDYAAKCRSELPKLKEKLDEVSKLVEHPSTGVESMIKKILGDKNE